MLKRIKVIVKARFLLQETSKRKVNQKKSKKKVKAFRKSLSMPKTAKVIVKARFLVQEISKRNVKAKKVKKEKLK